MTLIDKAPGGEGQVRAAAGLAEGGPVHGFMPRDPQLVPRGVTAQSGKFGRLFPTLDAFEPDDAALEALADAMIEPDPRDAALDNLGIPAGFTYLGQFIDHDLTFDTTALGELQVDPLALTNFRTASLDLDSLYGSGPAVAPQLYQRLDPDQFEIGLTSATPGRGDGSIPQTQNDLPRGPNGFAIIGDPRNDENLVVAQLHRIFLQFHNKVVQGIKDGSIQNPSPGSLSTFEAARQLVRFHYQWIVIHDFLARICDPAVLQDRLDNGTKLVDDQLGHDGIVFIPVEFSVAAYRLGHSMIRTAYNYNRVFTFLDGGVTPATLGLLFTFSGRSTQAPGEQPQTVPIPPDWVMDARRFFDLGDGSAQDPNVGINFSRKLDPFLAAPLTTVSPNTGIPNVGPPSASLPRRNLLRGKRVGLPTGQAVARYLGLTPLTSAEVGQGAAGQAAVDNGFDCDSPLWFYILKEAEVQADGRRLGAVGSALVAETFVAVLRRDTTSFLSLDPNFQPSLGPTPGQFFMSDLINFVGNPNPIG